MSFKAIFLTGSAALILGLVGLTVHYLRQAAAEAEATRRVLKAESDCVGQVQHAIELVQQRDSEKGIVNRVIESTSHYNHELRQCYVEVTTYEHRENAIYVKTLINPDGNTAVLWSVAGRAGSPTGSVLAPTPRALDCLQADQRWKTFMTQ